MFTVSKEHNLIGLRYNSRSRFFYINTLTIDVTHWWSHAFVKYNWSDHRWGRNGTSAVMWCAALVTTCLLEMMCVVGIVACMSHR